jgi:2-(1,2-epoxy-1,2-dihydrophenyl)acetyl-CoA isomerase
VLLTGAGKMFCGGGDVKGFADRDDLPTYLRETLGPLHVAITNLVRGDAPVVAAVQGSAAGAGMGLVGASDLVVAAESAKFVMAYTGVGLTPDGSSSWFLPRMVGLRRALDLTFTNRVLTAAEALEWGLISQVVPDVQLLDDAGALAARLATGPPRALAAAKRLLHTSLEETLETHLAREAEAISAASGTPEGVEGIAAFVEKRKPVFNRD